jgi:glycosyltransferase involved in cell wall biosynthesis
MKEPILIVSGDFVTTGGMDRANLALADHLARRGDPVHLVAHRADGQLTGRPNVALHRVRKWFGSYLLGEPFLRRAGMSWARRITAQGGRVVVNGGNCPVGDVNWVHYVHAAHAPVHRAGVFRGAKSRWAHRSALEAERLALGRARLIITNSELTRRQVLEHFGPREERVRTVYYGIDPNRFQPSDAGRRADVRTRMGWPADRPLAVFIGALGDRRKGFDTLFESWRQLCSASSWDADLVVIGAGAELSLWRRRAEDAGLGGRIHFLGFRRDVPELLPACDVLVAPARYEAYGLGVHEALCCGLPAVVSRSSGVAERYPPALEDLLLDDPENAGGLAALLRTWHERYETYRGATTALAEELRRYTWDHMAERIVRLMNDGDE